LFSIKKAQSLPNFRASSCNSSVDKLSSNKSLASFRANALSAGPSDYRINYFLNQYSL
jgi:hypothetical protein